MFSFGQTTLLLWRDWGLTSYTWPPDRVVLLSLVPRSSCQCFIGLNRHDGLWHWESSSVVLIQPAFPRLYPTLAPSQRAARAASFLCKEIRTYKSRNEFSHALKATALSASLPPNSSFPPYIATVLLQPLFGQPWTSERLELPPYAFDDLTDEPNPSCTRGCGNCLLKSCPPRPSAKKSLHAPVQPAVAPLRHASAKKCRCNNVLLHVGDVSLDGQRYSVDKSAPQIAPGGAGLCQAFGFTGSAVRTLPFIHASPLHRLIVLRGIGIASQVLNGPYFDTAQAGQAPPSFSSSHSPLHRLTILFCLLTHLSTILKEDLVERDFNLGLRGHERREDFFFDDTWDNSTFTERICNASSDVSVLYVTVSSSAQKWFRLPECVQNMTSLGAVDCQRCQLPNFSLLPKSIQALRCDDCVGTWSQFDSGNLFEGNEAYGDFFDWLWLLNLPDLVVLSLESMSTGIGINGTFPNNMSHSKLSTLSLRSNQLVGTVSPDLFFNFPALTQLYLRNNMLSGTLPNYGLEGIRYLDVGNNRFTHWPPFIVNANPGYGPARNFFSIVADSNYLVEIPSDSDFQAMNSLGTINLSDNPLGVPFPKFLSETEARHPNELLVLISAQGSGFTGSLPEIPEIQLAAYNTTAKSIFFLLSDNHFTGSIPTSWAGITFYTLNIQGNNGLNGTLATVDANGIVVSQFVKDAVILSLGPSDFTGPMFNVSTMSRLTSLTLNAHDLDMCASTVGHDDEKQVLFPQPSLSTCILTNTSANLCAWAFKANCQVDPTEPNLSDEQPFIAPTCPPPSPGPSFTCIESQWVSTGPVTQPTIVLPPHSTTIVKGDLNASSIVINSASSSINVSGCVSSPDGTSPRVTVTLTQEDLAKILKNGGSLTSPLIQQSPSCGSLATSDLVIDTKSIDSCRTIKVDKVASSSGLSAVFTLNSSKCNVWWIVLISVLFFVALVSVIVVIVVFKCRSTDKQKRAMAQLRG